MKDHPSIAPFRSTDRPTEPLIPRDTETVTIESPPRRRQRLVRVDLLMLLMSLIWGINFTVIKVSLEEFHPLSFNTIRFLLASALLTLAAQLYRRRRKVERPDLMRLILLGILGNTIYQVLFIEGINLTLAGNTALILGATPVFTTLLSGWRGHEHLRGRSLIGVLFSFAGVTLTVLSSHREISLSGTLIGDLLVFACTLVWSTYTVELRPLIVKYGYLECTRIAMISGSIPLVLLSIPSLRDQSWGAIHLAAWGGAIFSGAGAIALCYVIWNYGVRRLGNMRTATYSNVTPIIALLIAWAFLGEQPRVGQLIGMAAIVGGVFLTRIRSGKQPPLGGRSY